LLASVNVLAADLRPRWPDLRGATAALAALGRAADISRFTLGEETALIAEAGNSSTENECL